MNMFEEWKCDHSNVDILLFDMSLIELTLGLLLLFSCTYTPTGSHYMQAYMPIHRTTGLVYEMVC